MGPRRGAAARAVQGRSGVGLCRGAAAWGCAGAPQRGAVQGRSSVGAATWGCAGAQQRGAALECSVGLRWSAAWGCAGVPRGAALECSVVLRRGAAWGCAWVARCVKV